ncbi:MAG: hypothetical protein E6K99_06705, partial [Thaumarchaeota archaeon]
SISGYHIREAGSSAIQELAFTLADGFGYVELGKEAGLHVDEFAPRLSFFFNSTMDFFEEIAKFRAARRIWATVMREKYGAKDPRSLLMRFHTQTSGASLTWQQPLNNIVRTTIEALAGVLGGTQSLHTNSFDEAWALPTEKAVEVALRTQQIIAEETGVSSVVDPLGGSYYVEWLTEQMEEEAYKYFDRIESAGGILKAITSGYLQREIAENSYRLSKRAESGEDSVVGVNKYSVEEEEKPIETLKIDFKAQRRQIQRLKQVKKSRDSAKVRAALDKIARAYESERENSIYPMLEAVAAYGTLGEIIEVGRTAFGEWKEPIILCRGILVLARAFRDAGMEVIYSGLLPTPEQVARMAVDEDVDVVALSLLNGAHMTAFPRVKKLLEKTGGGEILVVGGGIIPEDDKPKLLKLGITGLYGPGTSLEEIIAHVKDRVRKERWKER